jgi:hypothetical protein
MTLTRAMLFLMLCFSLDLPIHAGLVTVGTGTPASCTETNFSDALQFADALGLILNFNCGAAPHTIVLTSAKDIAGAPLIDGGGKITLSAAGSHRIFTVAGGGGPQLSNLRLVSGNASLGGCLAIGNSAVASSLTLNNVTFESCSADSIGGALFAESTAVTVTGGSFANNSADLIGGGAIAVGGGTLQISGATFSNNRAWRSGGAVYVELATSATIADSVFRGNVTDSIEPPSLALVGGGALCVHLTGALTITDSRFIENRSEYRAGAILVDYGLAVFDRLEIVRNATVREKGGAIFVAEPTILRLSNSTLAGNIAVGEGGGIYSDRAQIEIDNSTFSANRASRGAAFHFFNGFAEISGATLVDNVIDPPAAGRAQIFVGGTSMTMYNSLFGQIAETTTSCEGTVAGQLNFSLWPDSSCAITAGFGNLPSTTALLKPLSLICGRTAVHRFATPNEPGIDGGACGFGEPALDQRGVAREPGMACDMGSIEYFEPCDLTLFEDGFESGTTAGWSSATP